MHEIDPVVVLYVPEWRGKWVLCFPDNRRLLVRIFLYLNTIMICYLTPRSFLPFIKMIKNNVIANMTCAAARTRTRGTIRIWPDSAALYHISHRRKLFGSIIQFMALSENGGYTYYTARKTSRSSVFSSWACRTWSSDSKKNKSTEQKNMMK